MTRSRPTTRLRAASIGPGVPRGALPVAVHSVFRGALNLECAGGLVTLLSPPAEGFAPCVRLAAAQDCTLLGLRPGDPGRLTPAGIMLERPGGPPLRVSFRGAARPGAAALPAIRRTGATWRAAVALLAALQEASGADLRIGSLLGPEPAPSAMGRRLAEAAAALGAAARSGAPGPAVGALVGLGAGLTPSGDDFLCGFLAAGHCRRAPGLEALGREVLARLPATHAISAALLRCAVLGQAGDALAALAQALRRGRGPGPALARLGACGHSSGLDAATGFLFGLSAWGGLTRIMK